MRDVDESAGWIQPPGLIPVHGVEPWARVDRHCCIHTDHTSYQGRCGAVAGAGRGLVKLARSGWRDFGSSARWENTRWRVSEVPALGSACVEANQAQMQA